MTAGRRAPHPAAAGAASGRAANARSADGGRRRCRACCPAGCSARRLFHAERCSRRGRREGEQAGSGGVCTEWPLGRRRCAVPHRRMLTLPPPHCPALAPQAGGSAAVGNSALRQPDQSVFGRSGREAAARGTERRGRRGLPLGGGAYERGNCRPQSILSLRNGKRKAVRNMLELLKLAAHRWPWVLGQTARGPPAAATCRRPPAP